MIVNQSFARKFLSTENPVGRVVTIGIVGPNAGSAEVVGLAGDAVNASNHEVTTDDVLAVWCAQNPCLTLLDN